VGQPGADPHVAYLEAGVGRGPVVVLVHGLASSSTT
jgi:pimeloyl-ACP methyl ester carboxylesterase